MKTFLTVLVAVSILAIGAMAFAHGSGGWGGGNMMGPGYGGHMMEQGYGGHMRGWTGSGNTPTQTDQKFLDETATIRKDLHNKKFEYFEAQRNSDTKVETLAQLEKEISELQEGIFKNAPRNTYRGSGGYGYCH